MFRIKALIAVVLIACLVLPACQSQEETDSLISEELIVPEKTEYKTFTAATGAISNFTGNRASLVYVNSRKLTWDVANSYFGEALVKDGAKVNQGDVLMTFYSHVDQSEIDAQKLLLLQKQEEVLDAKTAKLAAINDAKQAAQELTSYERKIADLKIKKQQIDYEKYVYETDIQIAALEEKLAELVKSLEAKELVAPFDGKVDILVEKAKGELIDTSEALIELYSYEDYYFVANAAENLRYNMEVSVDIGGSAYTGRVISAENIMPYNGSKKLDTTVRIKLDDYIEATQISLRLQYLAYHERVQDVLQVDSSYINNEETKKYVYILDGDVVRKRYITVGMTNRRAYWVLNGLSEGQLIING